MKGRGKQAQKTAGNSEIGGHSRGFSNDTGGEFLGREIKDLRRAKSMTLADLSKACGYSISFISQLERNLAQPSIKCLHDISRALGVGINWFFGEAAPALVEEREFVVRAKRRRRLEFESGITDELLSPNLSGELELLLSRFAPGANSGEESYAHRGEEAGLILSGSLELWVDGKHFVLNAGDSFAFPSTKRHRYKNSSDEETQVLWAITPPTY